MVVGALLSLLAATCYAFGNILQKRGVDGLQKLSLGHLASAVRQLVSSLPWLTGVGISVLGIVVQILAFQRVSISVVQSVGVAGTVLLVIASRVHFRESFNAREAVGLAISIGALLMTALSLIGKTSNAGMHADYVTLTIAITATLVVGVALLVTASRLPVNLDAVFGVTSGLFYGLVGLAAKGMSTLLDHRSLISGIGHIAGSPYPYVFLASWGLGIATFQAGIQRGRVGAIGPLSGAASAVYVVAVGTPVFVESLPSNVGSSVLRVAGFAGVLVGSLLLAWKAEPGAIVAVSEGGPRTPI
jgi:hypothetical protein